jgi:hypothetical protein
MANREKNVVFLANDNCQVRVRGYMEKIEKLRKDLMANREKNGVFLANDNYRQVKSSNFVMDGA